MTSLVNLLSVIVGITLLILIGRLVWQAGFQRNMGSLVPNVALILVATACWSGLRMAVPAVPVQTPAGSYQDWAITVFPASYKMATDNGPETEGYANSTATKAASLGTPMAQAIWDALTKNIGGGISLFAIVVAFTIGHAFVLYAAKPDPLALIGKAALLVFLFGAVAGAPSASRGAGPWVPRAVINVGCTLIKGITTAVDQAFHAKLEKQSYLTISPGSMMAMAYASRPPPSTLGPLIAVLAGARYQGVDIASAGYISDAAAARVSGRIFPVIPPTTGLPMIDIESTVGSRTERSRIPVEIYKAFDLYDSHAVYLGEDPDAWVDRFLRVDSTSPLQLLTFPERPNNEFTDPAWKRAFSLTYTKPTKVISVLPLGNGPYTESVGRLQAAIDRAYAAARNRIEQLTESEKKAASARFYSAGQGTVSRQLTALLAKIDQQATIANRILRPPTIVQASFSQGYLQAHGVNAMPTSLMDLARLSVRAAYAPTVVGTATFGAAGGIPCSSILTFRSYTSQNAWGCFLSALERNDRNSLSANDPVDAIPRYRRLVTSTFSISKASLVDSLFATPEARGVVDPEMSTVLSPVTSSATSGFFTYLAGMLQTLGAVTAFYPQEVVNAGLSVLAITAAPIVIGFSLAFMIAFWPIMALVSFLPGRWTAILDWSKALLWVLSWVPCVSLGRALIADVSLMPDNYALAQIQSSLGALVILSAPMITKVVLSPSVDGLAGVASAVVGVTVAKVGEQLGGGVDAIKSGGTSALDIGKQAGKELREIKSHVDSQDSAPSEGPRSDHHSQEHGPTHSNDGHDSPPASGDRPGHRTPPGRTSPNGPSPGAPGAPGSHHPGHQPPTRQSLVGRAMAGLRKPQSKGAVAAKAAVSAAKGILGHQIGATKKSLGTDASESYADRMAGAAAAGVDGNLAGASAAMRGNHGASAFPPHVAAGLSKGGHALQTGNLNGAASGLLQARQGAGRHAGARKAVRRLAEGVSQAAHDQLGTSDPAKSPKLAGVASMGEAVQAEMEHYEASDGDNSAEGRSQAAERRDKHMANARTHLEAVESAAKGGDANAGQVAETIKSILASIQQPSGSGT